jgi:hypothetical protein
MAVDDGKLRQSDLMFLIFLGNGNGQEHVAYRNESEDFEQAKRRIRQLLVEERHREHLAVAQRIRDQLSRICSDERAWTRALNWLDSEHPSAAAQSRLAHSEGWKIPHCS